LLIAPTCLACLSAPLEAKAVCAWDVTNQRAYIASQLEQW
jgi:hypothetical protein